MDYTRCPDTSGSAAINPMFQCTTITNEIARAVELQQTLSLEKQQRVLDRISRISRLPT